VNKKLIKSISSVFKLKPYSIYNLNSVIIIIINKPNYKFNSFEKNEKKFS